MSVLYTVTADGAVGGSGLPQFVHSVTLTAAGAAATLVLYDGTSTGGTKKLTLKAAANTTAGHTFGRSHPFNAGCYADIEGASAEASVEVE